MDVLDIVRNALQKAVVPYSFFYKDKYRNGSLFFLDFQPIDPFFVLGISCAHVHSRAVNGSECQIGGASFDPISSMLDLEFTNSLDIVTYKIPRIISTQALGMSGSIFSEIYIGEYPVEGIVVGHLEWEKTVMPGAIRTECLILRGKIEISKNGTHQLVLDYEHMPFGSNDDVEKLQRFRELYIREVTEGVPDREATLLSGCSGGPVLIQRERGGLLSYCVGGICKGTVFGTFGYTPIGCINLASGKIDRSFGGYHAS